MNRWMPLVRARFGGRGLTPLQWLIAAPLLLIVLASAIVWAALLTTFALIATVLFGVVLIFRPSLRRRVFGLCEVAPFLLTPSDYATAATSCPDGTIFSNAAGLR